MRSKWELKYKPQTLMGLREKKGSAKPNSKNYNRTPAPLFRPNHVGKAPRDGSILKYILKMPMFRYQMVSS